MLVLGAVLAPTDATLAQAVVSDTRVPVRIRQTVNVESGLNDGIALPAVTLAAAAAAGEFAGPGAALGFLARQVGLGAAVGAGVGLLGGRHLDARARAGAMSATAQQLTTLAVGVAAWALAGVVGGNGFVAAFVAGMAFGGVARERCHHLAEFAEEEGQLLVLLTWLLVGASLVGPALADATTATVAYAALSLTLVRMVPTALALVGSGVRPPTTLLLGWFGPRGLASVLFGLLVVEESGMAQADRVLQVVVLTVALSALLHGVTASPLAARYAHWSRRREPSAAEHQPVADLRPRIRFGPPTSGDGGRW